MEESPINQKMFGCDETRLENLQNQVAMAKLTGTQSFVINTDLIDDLLKRYKAITERHGTTTCSHGIPTDEWCEICC